MGDLPRPVQVLHDGRWYDGWLEAVRRDEDGWRGFVRYTVNVGATHVLWFGEDRIRRRDVE